MIKKYFIFFKYIIFFTFSILFIFIDQFTKYLAKIFLKNNMPFVLINGVLELSYVENKGAAFGILQGKFFLFFIVTIFVIVFIVYYLIKIKLEQFNFLIFSTLILIFSGAIGNSIDRFFQGYVVDFIYFKLINFPVFNFADILITISCICIFFIVCFENKKI